MSGAKSAAMYKGCDNCLLVISQKINSPIALKKRHRCGTGRGFKKMDDTKHFQLIVFLHETKKNFHALVGTLATLGAARKIHLYNIHLSLSAYHVRHHATGCYILLCQNLLRGI